AGLSQNVDAPLPGHRVGAVRPRNDRRRASPGGARRRAAFLRGAYLVGGVPAAGDANGLGAVGDSVGRGTDRDGGRLWSVRVDRDVDAGDPVLRTSAGGDHGAVVDRARGTHSVGGDADRVDGGGGGQVCAVRTGAFRQPTSAQA